MSNYYEYENTGQPGGGAPGMPMQGGMPMHGGMPMQPGYGYWGNRFRMGAPRPYGSETKPFFLTSEFLVSLLAAFGIAITAASSTAFGAWRAWILIAVLVAAYSLSRGIAKCGTRSRAIDPRENLELSWRRGDQQHEPQRHGAATAPYGDTSQYAPPA